MTKYAMNVAIGCEAPAPEADFTHERGYLAGIVQRSVEQDGGTFDPSAMRYSILKDDRPLSLYWLLRAEYEAPIKVTIPTSAHRCNLQIVSSGGMASSIGFGRCHGAARRTPQSRLARQKKRHRTIPRVFLHKTINRVNSSLLQPLDRRGNM